MKRGEVMDNEREKGGKDAQGESEWKEERKRKEKIRKCMTF